MDKSYAILEIRTLLSNYDVERTNVKYVDDTEPYTHAAQTMFNDLETIFKIYLGEAYSKQVVEVSNKQIASLKKELAAANKANDKLSSKCTELESKTEIPKEITITHKFDKASRNALVLAGYMAGRTGEGYNILTGNSLSSIYREAIE